jgi:hypothetical protein
VSRRPYKATLTRLSFSEPVQRISPDLASDQLSRITDPIERRDVQAAAINFYNWLRKKRLVEHNPFIMSPTL